MYCSQQPGYDIILHLSHFLPQLVKVKVKVHTLDVAPLSSESPPQKRSKRRDPIESFLRVQKRYVATFIKFLGLKNILILKIKRVVLVFFLNPCCHSTSLSSTGDRNLRSSTRCHVVVVIFHECFHIRPCHLSCTWQIIAFPHSSGTVPCFHAALKHNVAKILKDGWFAMGWKGIRVISGSCGAGSG